MWLCVVAVGVTVWVAIWSAKTKPLLGGGAACPGYELKRSLGEQNVKFVY